MEPTTIHADALRSVMRKVPSPVTVVTATGSREARGITIGSFTSVSLSPPLISFNVEQACQMHNVLNEAPRFAVHIPSEKQSYLCSHFAASGQSGAEQLGGVAHHMDEHNTPILEGVLAVLHCRSYDLFKAGDHSIVVGEIVEIEEHAEGTPILYYDRDYRKIRRKVLAV